MTGAAMSRDKSTTTEPTTKPILACMFEMLNDLEDDTVITGLPPTTASFVRTPCPDVPITDLTRLAKVWMLIGPGAVNIPVERRRIGRSSWFRSGGDDAIHNTY